MHMQPCNVLPKTLLAAALLGLAACAPAGDPPAPASTPAPAADAPPPVDTAPAPPASPPPAGDGGLARWSGYGDTTFGMDEAAFRTAWAGDLRNLAEDPACFHMTPSSTRVPADLAFMFGDGKFARYSTESATLLAPGGGKVGMARADIDRLYAGRIEEQPHKYTDGKYLRIREGASVLVFETDAAGKVTEWRVGVPPQVDYVEGCA